MEARTMEFDPQLYLYFQMGKETISEGMKRLQNLANWYNSLPEKAGIFDEIVSYLQSLQRQIKFPLLRPGEKEFVYESGTTLPTSSGSIKGSFRFVPGRLADPEGGPFEAELPGLDFSLTGLSETDFCPHIQWNEGPGDIVYMMCMQPTAFSIDCANVAGLSQWRKSPCSGTMLAFLLSFQICQIEYCAVMCYCSLCFIS
ncbi:hypothetical protein Patl1_26433 [Pistacia atlantica]|uniref:Uncharacterized protein n=1 Tax=Pistacia atlantica TaxID=434234 RepID=A0ACC1B1T1_9ROSI|nr:hypothetical protein Patl1_26433 [Pistacia atlantica]